MFTRGASELPFQLLVDKRFAEAKEASVHIPILPLPAAGHRANHFMSQKVPPSPQREGGCHISTYPAAIWDGLRYTCDPPEFGKDLRESLNVKSLPQGLSFTRSPASASVSPQKGPPMTIVQLTLSEQEQVNSVKTLGTA